MYDLREEGEFALSPPDSRDVVNDARVDDVWVHEAKRQEVVVQALRVRVLITNE